VLGLTTDYRQADFDKIVPAIAAGTYDIGMSSFTDTKDREKTVDFTSVDWQTYPILRFDSVPDSTRCIYQSPGSPSWGAVETGQGPAAASIANAVADATGKRLRICR